MAITLTPTLTLASVAGATGISSDALSFSITDALTIVSPIINISKITTTTTKTIRIGLQMEKDMV